MNPRTKILPLLLPLLLLWLPAAAQRQHPTDYFGWPTGRPWGVSGSFGELRPNHFHAGLDLPAGVGTPLYAMADGYVSRLNVSPTGYGNALYITHPNGYVTQYGHLDRFAEELARFVRQEQYAQRKFKVTLEPEPERFPVKKGQLVGYVGNTGSSGGPHLHFEIRDALTENPYNPMLFGLAIPDQVPPTLSGLKIFPHGPGSGVRGTDKGEFFELSGGDGRYALASGQVVEVFGAIGFSIQANDYDNQRRGQWGIFSIEVKVDGKLLFHSELGEISYFEHGFNSYLDYRERFETGRWMHRCIKDPGNPMTTVYRHVEGRGLAQIRDGAEHRVEIVVGDAAGNRSTLAFRLRGAPSAAAAPAPAPPYRVKTMPCGQSNSFFQPGLMLMFPRAALMDTLEFQFRDLGRRRGFFSPLYQVHDPLVPLAEPFVLSIALEGMPERLWDKALIASSSGTYLGGVVQDGFITARSRYFGEFGIRADTVPPTIRPLNIRPGARLSGQDDIRLTIEDDLSGVERYDAFLDGQWILLEQDAKRKLFFHRFDTERFDYSGPHKLRLEIVDQKGNLATYEAEFYR